METRIEGNRMVEIDQVELLWDGKRETRCVVRQFRRAFGDLPLWTAVGNEFYTTPEEAQEAAGRFLRS